VVSVTRFLSLELTYDARLGEINVKNRQYKVLIVDDDSAVGELLATLLLLKGHQCRAISNGAEAIDLIKKEHFDAVITDVELPLMDGLTLTRELLRLKPSIVVAVMTGFSDKYTSKDAVAAGASDFLDKPFNIDELSLRFEEMMDNHITHHRNNTKGS
jgi:DNA-binding NtrC family response regulator